MIDASDELRKVPSLLRVQNYGPEMINDAEALLDRDSLSLIEMRQILERFFRQTVLQSEYLTGVPFDRRQLENFKFVRDFAYQREWLSGDELSFIAAFYGLISDAVAHPGKSLIVPALARTAVLYGMWVTLYRIENRPRRQRIASEDAATKFDVAREFLRNIRRKNYTGRAFEVDLDWETMKLTRRMLQYSDVSPLFSAICNEAVTVGIRVNCASLIISPRCFQNDAKQAEAVRILNEYCSKNIDTLPWQVARAIGLALANRANLPDRLIEVLHRAT